MYIAPEQGQTTPWGQNFVVKRNSLSLCPFVASLIKNLCDVWFFTVFLCVFFHMSIAPGRGRQPIGDKNFMTTERLFAHILQVSKWSLWNLILCIFLMILYMYIALRQGQKIPWGQMLMSTESPYHFDHLLQVSNKSLWILILYTVFNVFPYVSIAPGQGQTTLCGQNPDVNRKAFSLCLFVASFKKKIFWSLILYIIFMFLYMYIGPRQGQTTPWCQNFYININLLSLWSSAVSSSIKWLSNKTMIGPRPKCYIPSHEVIGPLVLENKILE